MIKEPGLWPVLLVGTCLLLGLAALVVVRTFQSGNWFFVAGVGALLTTTVVSGIRDACMGRIGVVSRIAVSLWALAILAAFISMIAR